MSGRRSVRGNIKCPEDMRGRPVGEFAENTVRPGMGNPEESGTDQTVISMR